MNFFTPRVTFGLFILSFLILITNQPALATEYFVTPDSGGSAPSGMTTISLAALSAKYTGSSSNYLKAGDTVYFASGETYTGSLCVAGSGTSTNHVTFTTTGADTATLKASGADCSGWQSGTGVLIHRSNYIDMKNLTLVGKQSVAMGMEILSSNNNLTGLNVSGFGNAGIYFDSGSSNDTVNSTTANSNGYVGIAISGGSNILVSHSIASYNGIYLTGGAGLMTSQANGITVEYSEFGHNSSHNGVDGDGFDFDWSTTNSIAQYNYSHDNDGSGFMFCDADGANPSDNLTYRYNLSINNGRHNNYADFDVNDYPATGHSLRTKTSKISHFYIYNNTAYSDHAAVTSGTPSVVRIGVTNQANSTGKYVIVLANNLLMTNEGSYSVPLVELSSNGNAISWLKNGFWAAGGSSKYGVPGSVPSAGNFDLSSPEVQPGLVGISSTSQTLASPADFNISDKNSPVIGQGLSVKEVQSALGGSWPMGLAMVQDYYGTSLNQVANLEIGAAAYTGSSSGSSLSTGGTNTGTSAKWYLMSGGNNKYCLNIWGGSQAAGTPVKLYQCEASTVGNEEITFNTKGEMAVYGGTMCLDSKGSSNVDGTPLVIEPCTGSPTQTWKFSSSGTPAAGTITNTAGKCIDVTERDYANATIIELFTCNSGANQTWVESATP
jgi:hypothetical protein